MLSGSHENRNSHTCGMPVPEYGGVSANGFIGRIYWPDENGLSMNETDLTGGTAIRNVYVGGMQIARQDENGNWWYPLHDHLGSTRMVLDATGNNVYDVDFYPHGTVAVSNGSTTNLYGFTGYETDTESATNYAVFRQQSPTLGRFMRPDPYDGSYDITNPQTFNRYSYVLNNPTNLVDPVGLCGGALSTASNPLGDLWNDIENWFCSDSSSSGGGDDDGVDEGGEGDGGGAGIAGGGLEGGSPSNGGGTQAPNNGLNPVGPNPCSGANPANLNYSAVNNYRGGPMTALNHIAMNHINSVDDKSTYSGGPGGPFGAVGNMMRLNALTLTQGTLMSVSSNGAIVLTYFEPPGSIVLGPITLTYGTVGTDQNGARTQYNTLVVKGCTVPQTSYPGTPFPLQP